MCDYRALKIITSHTHQAKQSFATPKPLKKLYHYITS